MKVLRGALCLLLAWSLGLEPAFAQVRAFVAVQPGAGTPVAPVGVKTVYPLSAGTLGLPVSTLLIPVGFVPGASPAVAARASSSSRAVPATLGPVAEVPSGAAAALNPAALTPGAAAFALKKVAPLAAAAAEEVRGLADLPQGAARTATDRQFSLLSGEAPAAARADLAQTPVPVAAGGSLRALLSRPRGAESAENASSEPAPPASRTQVFKDPERNGAFWRYALAYSTYLFGFQMYIVGMPFLVSSFTKNLLYENHDPRFGDSEAVKALVRSNRSLSRIMHWIAQAVSYATVPLLGKKGAAAPGTWLSRSAFARAAVIALIPTLFFASGLFSLKAAILVYLGLVMLQSYLQGVFVTMDSAATTRIMGEKSVSPEERLRANSILTFIASTAAIIGPALAGKVAQLPDFFNKTGSAGAVIYGIYAGTMALGGLIFASIRLLGRKDAALGTDGTAAESAASEPLSAKAVLSRLWASMRDGSRMIFKNRLLRTFTLLLLVNALFSDPLIFSILPEFVETLVKIGGGGGEILGIPVIGWLLRSITETPMGYYGLMVAASSVGSILATLAMEPLRKVLARLGFRTEESLTVPFYLLAAVEVPLFWLLVSTGSIWAALGIYGLQSLVTAFAGIVMSGLYQKALGSFEREDVPKVLAARSFMNICAAILSTYVFGFVLKGVPLATMLTVAAVAMTALGALRVAAPWLMLSKEERTRAAPPTGPASD
ncbi:MAG: hypothetical protein WC969_11945 [Elusimicrobiota bacterium]|jgi:hypothetical protein